MFSQEEVDARFFELAWCYYMALVEDLTDYAVRSMERMQAPYDLEDN